MRLLNGHHPMMGVPDDWDLVLKMWILLRNCCIVDGSCTGVIELLVILVSSRKLRISTVAIISLSVCRLLISIPSLRGHLPPNREVARLVVAFTCDIEADSDLYTSRLVAVLLSPTLKATPGRGVDLSDFSNSA